MVASHFIISQEIVLKNIREKIVLKYIGLHVELNKINQSMLNSNILYRIGSNTAR